LFGEGTQSGVKEQIALVKQIGRSHRSQSFEFARNNDEAHELWSARKEALWSVMALRRDENDQYGDRTCFEVPFIFANPLTAFGRPMSQYLSPD